ncbi:MAG: ABC transporter permease [Lachnospiraceae bacterium]|nr:ABC transporter permease [Lachnospiraceae bacterium]
MRGFSGLTKRNVIVFLKDRQSVVFSLLTSIIVLVLYLLFLKGTFVDAIETVLSQQSMLSGRISAGDIDMFANLILVTGILGSAMITVPFNCLTTIVRDRENRVDYDILATPVKRWQIVLSYYLAGAFSSILLNGIILTVALMVIRMQGNLYLSAADICQTYGIVALGSVSATAVFMILVLFFKTSSASGAFFGILSAASGFVIGAYIPISQFSEKVQTVCNIFPASQVTILLRNKLLGGLLGHMDESIGGIDEGMFVSSIKEIFSFQAKIFSRNLEIREMVCYIAVVLMISLVAMTVIYSKNYRKK